MSRYHLLTMYEITQQVLLRSNHVPTRHSWPDCKFHFNESLHCSRDAENTTDDPSESLNAIINYETYKAGSYILFNTSVDDGSTSDQYAVIENFLVSSSSRDTRGSGDLRECYLSVRQPARTTRNVARSILPWHVLSKRLEDTCTTISVTQVVCKIDVYDYARDSYVVVDASKRRKMDL